LLQHNETITLIARETGWSLEYIRNQPISYLNALAEEISYQRAVEAYERAYNTALIICALVSDHRRRYKPVEIIGHPPQRRFGMGTAKLAKEPKTEKLRLADGKEYILAPLTANMMAEVEDRFDKPWEELAITPMRKRPLIMILWLRLRENYPELTEEQVGNLLTADMELING